MGNILPCGTLRIASTYLNVPQHSRVASTASAHANLHTGSLKVPQHSHIGQPTLAPSENRADQPNPAVTGKYSCPIMHGTELKDVTVAFEEISTRLEQTLAKYGVAVVTGVANAAEIRSLEDDFKSDLNTLVDQRALETAPETVTEAYRLFQENGPRAFNKSTFSRIGASSDLLLKKGMSQGKFAWSVRNNTRVHETFKVLFPKAQGLVTSLDVPFFSPSGSSAACSEFSAHADQNLHDVRPGLASNDVYQGILYVWPATEDEASSTVVWPESHRKVWPEMMKDDTFIRYGAAGFHYSQIQQMENVTQRQALAAGWASAARRVPVPAGGLLLWNSRTIHAGWKAGPRLAQAVCLEPIERRSDADRISKMRLCSLGLPSVHWAGTAQQHDCILWDPGALATATVEARDAYNPEGSVLPLAPAIWPKPLAHDADLPELRKLIRVNYVTPGLWQPPAGIDNLLDASVSGDYKTYL